ncbi:uncharacterized protein LOC119596594 [Penaeus monodon]|uniref:uncharacterized protein LOC119596594 n=1 Tax=Penaeus monodon TaxID=6687 RepID=UPI0018A76362|nr:uncharacterized protein LOC119596594 [Penaeus monodon]
MYKNACKEMTATCKWARNRWQEDTKRKLSTLGAGSKEWWSLVKEYQGETRESTIPPLTQPDGTTASSNREKANLLGSLFSRKMTVPDANRTPPEIPSICHEQLPGLQICCVRTKEILQNLNTKKHQVQMISARKLSAGVRLSYPSLYHLSSSRASKKAAGPPFGRKQE